MFSKQHSPLKEILKSMNPYEPCVLEFLHGRAAYLCGRSTKVTLRSVMVVVVLIVIVMVMKNMKKLKSKKGDDTGEYQR